MISTTYIAVAVNILSFVLPKFGITLGSSEITTTVQTLITIGSGLWIMFRRHKLGDITAFGSYR